MGLIVSRFKKSNTKDQLESIEKDIKNINEYRIYTQQKQKQFLGSLVAVSVVVYVCFASVFYLYYFPSELSQQIVYSLPLVLFPLLVWILRELMKWFFQERLRKNETRLTDLLRKKRKILEDVMETETYKVARELLEKYDPDQFRKTGTSNEDIMSAVSEPVGVRQRTVVPRNFVGRSSPNLKSQMSVPVGRSSASGAFSQGMNSIASFQPGMSNLRPPGPPMPRPILPRERTFMERLIEYLVGDGPNTRYALICRQCNSHNGMALKEEFEYIAFRCCYCYYWNPARKQRPAAPRLPEQFLQSASQESLLGQSKTELAEVAEEKESESGELLEEEIIEEAIEDAQDQEEIEREKDGHSPSQKYTDVHDDDKVEEEGGFELEPVTSDDAKPPSEEDGEPYVSLLSGSEILLEQEKEEQPKGEIGEGDQPSIRVAEAD